MISDYDDTHFCLKCHVTILGLDNYVAHRKAGCVKNIENIEEPLKSPSQVLRQDETFSLKADDFFSSLELQSSAKKTAVPPTTGGKSFSGILTRSKTTAVIQASKKEEAQELPSPKLATKSAWVADQSKIVKSDDRKRDELQNIRSYEESEEELDDSEYEEESEDEDNQAPPRSYTGGKWKPSSPVHWNRPSSSHSWQPPPPGHTKGKWKPQSPVLPMKENYNIPPPSFTGSKWTPSKSLSRNEYLDVPPPSHTKGKWKPGDRQECDEVEPNDYDHPPPGHTKGKWKPGNMPTTSNTEENKGC